MFTDEDVETIMGYLHKVIFGLAIITVFAFIGRLVIELVKVWLMTN